MDYLLRELKRRDRDIRVSIVGIGSVGQGMLYQCHATPGFVPVVAIDLDVDKVVRTAARIGLPYRVVVTEAELCQAVDANVLAIARDAKLLESLTGIDVMIDSSSAIYGGYTFARAALENGQHVVMMNSCADLLYGPLLLQQAEAGSLVYTFCDGDQPSVIKKLVDETSFWGFEPVMLGNIKGYMDLYSDPTRIIPEAAKRDLDPKMCASYTDGSKLGVEMALTANGLNGHVLKPGMTGPRLGSVHEIFDHFDFAEIWKPGDGPIVDYVLGAEPKGGVFMIGYCDNPIQKFYLDWFPSDNGPGPYYLFYRPYHLCHIEALQCVAEAVLFGTGRLSPKHGLRTNVIAYAKRDLQPGDMLDGIGGYLTYGLIENVASAAFEEGVPQLICDGMRVKRPIRKDERLALADVEFDAASAQFQAFRESLEVSGF